MSHFIEGNSNIYAYSYISYLKNSVIYAGIQRRFPAVSRTRSKEYTLLLFSFTLFCKFAREKMKRVRRSLCTIQNLYVYVLSITLHSTHSSFYLVYALKVYTCIL